MFGVPADIAHDFNSPHPTATCVIKRRNRHGLHGML
jgi:hypothetical protein